uniref:Rho GTPase activating protein 22 n=1 Tax=Electrophorus electricus TaxID=8005 RepID=A0A4W4E0U9_ELEEL
MVLCYECKCLFYISGAAGEKDRTAVSHEALLLMANSQTDMDDWVKAIRRVIWAPFGGGIFGQRLEDTVQHEKKFGPRLAPLLVEQCVDFIREQGLGEEGLFRMPGQANLVRELQDAFDCGDKPQFDRFLDEVQSHSAENKMSVQNLATVFGPNILRPKMEDPVAIMEGTSLVQHLMTVLISKHDQLYPEQDSEVPEPCLEVRSQGQQPQQSSLVGWISEEDLQSLAPAGNSNPSDNPTSSSASSLDGSPAGPSPKSGSQGKSETAVSPSKQAKTLPSWKYTFKGSSTRPPPAKTGSSSSDMGGVSSGNWLMNGLSSLRGHRRTSTGERAKDSGTSQRLSTYDNVTSSSSPGSMLSIDSAPWSTSSCEFSVPESCCDPLDADSQKDHWLEPEENLADISQSAEEVKPAEQEDASISMEARISTTCCSDNSNMVPIIKVMAEDDEESPSSLASLVAELRENLRKQKQAYESRIKKLEESSAVLCAQMERLEHEMEQERKMKRMLEIKLRNSERAREDAENRNRLLEKEMEDFFSTLGDLALGARTSDI